MLAAAAAAGSAGLRPARASAKAPYGVAVALEPFRDDPQLADHLIEHADLIVPMNALKWGSLRHTPDQFDFAGADELVAFGERHGRPLHGHALLWYAFNPPWLDAITSGSRLERLLDEHIDTVVSRYRGRIASWDVVNEAISHDPAAEGRWRGGVWHDLLGPRHIDLAFARAARADPAARLAYNDYDLEDDTSGTLERQRAVIALVERLQDRNIPIHQIGMQAHLYAERDFGHDNLHAFLRRLQALGVGVSITELDVIDWKLPADPGERDAKVAAVAQEYLSSVFSQVKPASVTTWGMSDRHSWINGTFPRDDGAKARPLPFDADWTPKPLWEVVRRFTG